MTRQANLFINSLRGGGAENVCVTIANELSARGWRVRILVLNLDDAVLQSRVASSVDVVSLNCRHTRGSIPAIYRAVRRYQPEHILAFNHQLAIVLVAIRAICRLRFRIISRNISTLSAKSRFQRSWWHKYVVHWLTSLIYRYVDVVIAQSEHMLNDLRVNFGVPENRLMVIPNPLSPRIAHDYDTSASASSTAEILYVGRLVELKDVGLILDAFRQLTLKDGTTMLRIVGEGPLRASLEKKAMDLEIRDKVDFAGFVQDPVPFYRQASVVVLASHYEGFPNVLLEAMSQGTPAVAVYCPGGVPELIDDGVNGLLVAERDAAELAKALATALEMRWDASAIRASTRKFAVAEVVDRYAALLATSSSRAETCAEDG